MRHIPVETSKYDYLQCHVCSGVVYSYLQHALNATCASTFHLFAGPHVQRQWTEGTVFESMGEEQLQG